MRRFILRLLGVAIVGVGVALASGMPAEASRSLGRCYIDEVDYHSDATCTEVVGLFARDCDGQLLWYWGVQSSYWVQYIDGGYPYCPSEGCGEEWHETLFHNCPTRAAERVSPQRGLNSR